MKARLVLLSALCTMLLSSVPALFAAPTVTLSPTSLTFGNQAEGVTSAPQSVTLTNSGTSALTITKIQVTGANAADFAQTNNCPKSPATLAAGANCSINVTFTPLKGGPRSAAVSVTDNATGSPQKVTLSGTGLAPAVTFSPQYLNFGDQQIGGTTAPQSITVTNIGQAPLAIANIAVAGANPSEYNLSQNCGSSLAISATCTYTVTFSPSAAWARTAAVMMTDNAQGSPHVVGMAGNGTSGGVATFSPTSLTFSNRLIYTTSIAQNVTLTNTGSAPLQLASIMAAGDYAQVNNCPITIAVSASCTVKVTFTPTFSAARPGWLNFNFTDPAGVQTVALSGGGALPNPVAITPKSASVTPNQTVQYVALISGVQSNNVTWYVDGVLGGNSALGTISSAGLYTPPPSSGSHLVKVVNNANTKQSALAPVVVATYPGTLTHHNDTYRTGQNAAEAALNTGNVNKNQFGKLFSYPVDGQTYAEPLWLPNVNISGTPHNVVFVATENDSVYAFDADSAVANPNPLWHASFINPPNVTAIPKTDIEVGLDLSPIVGITSTPAIDTSKGIIYVEARTKDTTGTPNCPGPYSTSPYFHFLHALNVATGAEMPGSPVMVCASIPGIGYNNEAVGGIVYFNPMRENQRPAMLLLNGTVFMAFGALEDIDTYHGWILGYTYSSGSLPQTYVYNDSPNGAKGGIWQGGGGLLADSSGYIYTATGNGTFDANIGGSDYGMTFLKLQPDGSTLNVTDYFAPFNQNYLNLEAINADLSSAGPMLLPDPQPGSDPHLAIASGKTGSIYLLNRDNLGGFNPTFDNVVQVQYTTIGVSVMPTGNWGTPAYFRGNIYLQGIKDPLKQYEVAAPPSGGPALLSGGPLAVGQDIIGYPSPTPVVTYNAANPNQSGIVWVTQSDGTAQNAASTLRAYDAANIAHEVYNSGQAGARDKAGPAVKFATPTVANGKVYVQGASQLDVYGLLP